MKRRSRLLAVALVAGLVPLLAAMGSRLPAESPAHYIRVTSSYADYSLIDLLTDADAVAIVAAVGKPTIHWNSATNQPWALDQIGRLSHIYADQAVRVQRVFRGSLPEELTVRSVGGTVGDYAVEYEGAATWKEGAPVLALLRREATGTAEGREFAWTLVRSGHGLFLPAGDGAWANLIGLTVTQGDLLP